jgi:hypothetical protein
MKITLLSPWLGHPIGSTITVANSMGKRLGGSGKAKKSDAVNVFKHMPLQPMESNDDTETGTGTGTETVPEPEAAEATKEVARMAGARPSK